MTIHTDDPHPADGGPALLVGPPAPGPAGTLADLIRRAAGRSAPDALVCVAPDGAEFSCSYAELLDRAARVLGGLRAAGVRRGQPVLLQCGPRQDFLAALWACLLGGMPAVPLAPAPSYQRENQALRLLRDLLGRLDGCAVLASASLAGPIRGIASGAPVLALEEMEAAPAADAGAGAAPDEVALMLLSSGSTGAPKLILRTHDNVLHNAGGLGQGDPEEEARRVFLNWLPLEHNAGLMASIGRLAAGGRQVQVATERVAEEPLRWLEYLTRYAATNTAATNYVLSLVNEAVAAGVRPACDLRPVRHLAVTGEPVVPRTALRFLELLRPYGLDDTVLRPAYGMSEAGSITRYTGFSPRTVRADMAAVPVGEPNPGIEVRIVDDAGATLRAGAAGRIQVRGRTVMPGYHASGEAAGGPLLADGWLETGDLGCIADGLLFITGRDKDVVIVNGVNFFSQEIEAVVEGVPGVEPAHTAACGVRDAGAETDALAVFLHAGVRGGALHDLLAAVRQRIAEEFGLQPRWLVPVERGEIPRTATGKLQRRELARQLGAGAFEARLHRLGAAARAEGPSDPPRTPLERQVAGVWAEVLELAEVGRYDNFFERGGHSLAAARLVARLRAALQVEISVRDLFEAPTLAELAAAVARAQVEQHDRQSLAALVAELDSLTDDEVRHLLATNGA